MKNSIYNSLIPITSSTSVLYNAYSDTFLAISTEASKLLCNPASIKFQWKTLYKELIKHEFYVPDKLDEFERLKLQAYRMITRENSFFLIVNPTLDCNLQCWYCYENHLRGSVMQENVQQRIKLFIEQTINSGIKSFTLGFFGGEPLMKYKSIVRPLIEYAKEICEKRRLLFNTTFTSNGTLLTPYIVQEITSLSPTSFQITLDGDEEGHNKVRFFHNQKGTYSVIMQNIKLLLAKQCHVTLRINYTTKNIRSIYVVAEELKKLQAKYIPFLSVDFHRVWQDKTGTTILPEVKELTQILNENKIQATYNNLNEIKNPCYGDQKNTAVINYNGDVFKCTAKDFTTENREGYLDKQGKIIWEKSQEHRLNSKLTNKLCRTCNIAPLCGSGCTRYILDREAEGKTEYCVLDFDEKQKLEIVINQIERIIQKHEISLLSTI